MKNVKLSLFLIAPFLLLLSCNNTEGKFSIYDPNESETKAYLDRYCVYETAVEECLISMRLELDRPGELSTSFVANEELIIPFVMAIDSIVPIEETNIVDGQLGPESYDIDYHLRCYIYESDIQKARIEFRSAPGCRELKLSVHSYVDTPFQPMYKRERRYTFDEASERIIIDAAEECFENFAQIDTSNESEAKSA